MKATILLGTLKRSGLSNTETLCEFLSDRRRGLRIEPEIVKLSQREAKHEEPTREELLAKYAADYTGTADRMIRQLIEHAGR